MRLVNEISELKLTPSFGKMPVICFDMDGVICEDTLGKDTLGNKVDPANWTELQWEHYFYKCTPIKKTIAIMDRLCDLGCRIKIYTARPTRFTKVTVLWLTRWYVYYDDLKMNKPAADLYIDDKGLRYTSSNKLIEDLQKNLFKGELNV